MPHSSIMNNLACVHMTQVGNHVIFLSAPEAKEVQEMQKILRVRRLWVLSDRRAELVLIWITEVQDAADPWGGARRTALRLVRNS